MRVVHKFKMQVDDDHVVMPASGVINSIQHADGDDPHTLTIWATVDPDDTWKVRRNITITGTGHPTPEGWMHYTTIQAGPFVWHVWRSGAGQ